MLYIICVLITLIMLFIFYIFWKMSRSQTPTKGAIIDIDNRPKSALMIIEMQEDFTRVFPEDEVTAKIAVINQLVLQAQANGDKIINIRQIFLDLASSLFMKIMAKGVGTIWSHGLQFEKSLDYKEDVEFIKTLGDSFSEEELSEYLEKHQIGHLTIVGLNGCYCINSTARGALNRGYKVTLIEGAILASHAETWENYKAKLTALGANIP